MNKKKKKLESVRTALLLAAGTGSRLYPLTSHEPKCMTMVNGKTILERLISNLNRKGINRLVVVTGHLEQCIRKYLGNQMGNIKIEYIFSPLYKTTNNIYSLWMARNHMEEPFLLLESDLIFDESLLDEMIYPDRIALAEMQPWMNGTCVTLDESEMVDQFVNAEEDDNYEIKYKTVNIYSFSIESWKKISDELENQISAKNVNCYYETVFADLISENEIALEPVSFDHKPWYEIDTVEDLIQAEKIFPAGAGKPQNSYCDTLQNPVFSIKKVAGVLNAAK